MSPHSGNQSGFSLIELVVAMAVMLLIMGSVFALMKDSIRLSTTTHEQVEAQQSLRTAQEYFNRDLTTAGNGLLGIGNIRVSRNFATQYLARNPTGAAGSFVNLALVESDNEVPAGTSVPQTTPATTVFANPGNGDGGTDRITVLSVDPDFAAVQAVMVGRDMLRVPTGTAASPSGTAQSMMPGEIYFISSGGRAAFVVTKEMTAGAGNNTDVNCTADNLNGIIDFGLNYAPSAEQSSVQFVANVLVGTTTGGDNITIRRMRLIHYFINDDKLLIRRVFGVKGDASAPANNRKFVDSVIAENITDLDFTYNLYARDASGDLRQPTGALTTATRLSVRQIEVKIEVETNRKIVARLNANGSVSNEPQKITAVSAIAVRNMQFRNALQPSGT